MRLPYGATPGVTAGRAPRILSMIICTILFSVHPEVELVNEVVHHLSGPMQGLSAQIVMSTAHPLAWSIAADHRPAVPNAWWGLGSQSHELLPPLSWRQHRGSGAAHRLQTCRQLLSLRLEIHHGEDATFHARVYHDIETRCLPRAGAAQLPVDATAPQRRKPAHAAGLAAGGRRSGCHLTRSCAAVGRKPPAEGTGWVTRHSVSAAGRESSARQ